MELCPHALVIDRRRRVDGRFCRHRAALEVATGSVGNPPIRTAGAGQPGGDDVLRRVALDPFIATLYMQDLRGWSALETGVAFLPTGWWDCWSRRAWRHLSSALGCRR